MSRVVSILCAEWPSICSGCSYLRATPVHFLLDVASPHTTSYRWGSALEVTSSKGFPSNPSQIRPWLVWGGQPGGGQRVERVLHQSCPRRLIPAGDRPSSLEVHSLTECRETAWASASTCKQRLWKSKVVSLSPLKQTSSAACFGRFADVSAEWAWIFLSVPLASWSRAELSCHLRAPNRREPVQVEPQPKAFLSRSGPPLTLSSPSVVRCPIERLLEC